MIWTLFILYSLISVWLGWKTRTSAIHQDEFWTAGRSLSGWSAGLSLSAGFLSVSWSCVYAIQVFYQYGWAGFFLMTLPWMAALAGIWWLAPRFRPLMAFSQPEMVRSRFGKAYIPVALSLIVVFLIWGGAELFTAAQLLAPQLKVSPNTLIWLIAGVIGIYTLLGGFSAVVSTDKFQYVLIVIYLLVITGLTSGIPQFQITSFSDLGSHLPGLSAGSVFVLILLTWIAYLPGWLSEADLWLRIQAAQDKRQARKAALIGLVNAFLFVGVVPYFIAAGAWSVFPAENGKIPAELGQYGESVINALLSLQAPFWLTGLLSVGLIAAAMSTIDTCINVVSLTVNRDLAGKQVSSLIRMRAAHALIVLLTGAAAMATDNLWDIFYLSSGLLTAAVAFPVLGLLLPGVKAKGVQFSSWAGLLGTTTGYFLQKEGLLVKFIPAEWLSTGLEYILFGLIVAAIGYLVGRNGRENLAKAPGGQN
ncbi:MAG: hypothetical protein L6Q77_12070 [Bacteroidetes bacterium]|nr:hypothetical protein [Bacteroidota bacterium]